MKFTISIPRESCINAKAKYSSSVVPPDPSVHFYHCRNPRTKYANRVNPENNRCIRNVPLQSHEYYYLSGIGGPSCASAARHHDDEGRHRYMHQSRASRNGLTRQIRSRPLGSLLQHSSNRHHDLADKVNFSCARFKNRSFSDNEPLWVRRLYCSTHRPLYSAMVVYLIHYPIRADTMLIGITRIVDCMTKKPCRISQHRMHAQYIEPET